MTDQNGARTAQDRAPAEPERERERERDPEGGEPACLLNRICPGCDAVLDTPPPTTCHRCGEVLPGD